jgi:hypothetical protein
MCLLIETSDIWNKIPPLENGIKMEHREMAEVCCDLFSMLKVCVETN